METDSKLSEVFDKSIEDKLHWINDVNVRRLMEEIFKETLSDTDLPEFITKGFTNYKRLIEEIKTTREIIVAGSENEDIRTLNKFLLVYPSDLIIIKKKIPLDVLSSTVKVEKNLTQQTKIKLSNRSSLTFSTMRSIFRIIAPKIILIATPVEIKFHNYQLNKLYKKKAVIKNVSNTIARYQIDKRPEGSKFRVIVATSRGEKEHLAPGMQAFIIIYFKSEFPDTYTEQVNIRVQNGKSIIIHVRACRDYPVLEINNIDNPCLCLTSKTLTSQVDVFNEILSWNDFQDDDNKFHFNCDPMIESEIECGKCFVDEEINIKLLVKNTGGDGKFFLINEIDWCTMNINNITEDNVVKLNCFNVSPAYFLLKRNETLILNFCFAPITYGMHVDKLLIICDNCSIKLLDILGDGILFDKDFIQFKYEGENQVFIDNWFIDLGVISIDKKLFSITNSCELEVYYYWKKMNSIYNYGEDESLSDFPLDSIKIDPISGLFLASSTQHFILTIDTINLDVGNYHTQLQLFLEDIPASAFIKKNTITYACENKRRNCLNSIDICIGCIEVHGKILSIKSISSINISSDEIQ